MTRRAKFQILRVLAVALAGATIAAPASARSGANSRGAAPGGAASGGAAAPGAGRGGAGGPSGGGAPTGSPSVTAEPAGGTVTASANGITLASRADGVLRRPMSFTGNVDPRAAGETVEIERRGRQTGWTWAPTTHATVAPDGSFAAVWPVNHIGRFTIRLIFEGGPVAHAATASPTLTITVYRPSLATLYGPGFYGGRTACGEILRPGTLGVANRTLPCGTPVAILYGGRRLVVPVIDRGPYAHGADWDLTMATGRALGITGTETIDAVSLPR